MSRRPLAHGRGAIAVEAALFLPVLAVLLSVGLEYGWMVLKVRQLDGVVEQAAEVGASTHGSTAMVRTVTQRLLAESGLAGLDYELEVLPLELSPDLATGALIEVTLSLPYAPLSLTGLGRRAPGLLHTPDRLVVRADRVKRGAR